MIWNIKMMMDLARRNYNCEPPIGLVTSMHASCACGPGASVAGVHSAS